MPASQSQKRNRTLIALSLLLLVLVSFTQFFPAANTEVSRQKFSSLTSNQINKIAVESQNHLTMLFAKLDNGWHLIEPFKRRADNSRIQLLLAVLSLPKANIYDSEQFDIKSVGLDPPRATLTLNDTAFFFGNKENNNNLRYVQTAGKITLIADIVYPLLSQGLFGFVEKTLVPPGFVHIESDNYALSKTNNHWQSNNGTAEDAQSIVAAWLGELSVDVMAWPIEATAALENSTKHRVKFKMDTGEILNIEIYEMQELSLIHPEATDYALVITAEQFQSLKVSQN